MGFLDKLVTGGGVVLLSAFAKSLYKDAQEEKRRKNSPLCFDEGLTQNEFIEITHDIAMRTPRVFNDVVVTGMTATFHVGSISGLSTWKAEIDFNDYGHLTGKYWLSADNQQSLIPKHLADAVKAQIERRIGRTDGELSTTEARRAARAERETTRPQADADQEATRRQASADLAAVRDQARDNRFQARANSRPRWVPPPSWPATPSATWEPPAGWQPDPAWGPAPPGWVFWR